MNMTGRLGVTKDKALEMLREGWYIESRMNGAALVWDGEKLADRRWQHLNSGSFSSLIRRKLIAMQPGDYPAIWRLTPEGRKK